MSLKKSFFTVLLVGMACLSLNAQTNGSTNLLSDGFFTQAGTKMGVTAYKIFNATNVQTGSNPIVGWQTTASDNDLEVWKSGFQSVPAPTGTQYFAELNANQVASDFQVVQLNEASPVSFTLAHRGRNGVDVMKLNIWDLGTNTTWYSNAPFASLQYTQTLSDSNSVWGYYGSTNLFTPNAGDYYAFQFQSVSAAGGNQSIGNFVSAIQFGYNVQDVPEPSSNTLLILGSLSILFFIYRLRAE